MATVAFNQVQHDKVLALPVAERWRKGMQALHEAAQDTTRTDLILYAYEHLNAGGEKRRAARFYRQAAAQRLYEENRTMDATTLDFDTLAALPQGTLGHAYASFMRGHGITPDIFTCEGPLTREAYLIKRMRQTHDLWHTVTDIDVDVPGELELQAFTLAQVWAPSLFVVVIGGALRALFRMPSAVPGMVRGFFRGLFARSLVAVPWEDLWATPIAEVRRQLRVGVTTAPRRLPSTATQA
jgi:ubiquinone biosynthesis protein Coq4